MGAQHEGACGQVRAPFRPFGVDNGRSWQRVPNLPGRASGSGCQRLALGLLIALLLGAGGAVRSRGQAPLPLAEAPAVVLPSGLKLSGGTSFVPQFAKDLDATPDAASPPPAELAAVGSTVFFVVKDAASSAELWKSDGTTAGTGLVKDISAGPAGSYPAYLAAVGSTVFFSAYDSTTGNELWKSDGTAAGTVRVKDIRVGTSHSYPNRLTPMGDTLFFVATDSAGAELWKSDGTEAGTVRVKDIQSAGSSGPAGLTVFGSELFFSAADGWGVELWKSDGTEAGTVRVKDIRPSSASSSPAHLTVVGSTLFLTANDGSSGIELWKSDGTGAGTVRVRDIRSGAADSSPAELTAVGTTLFFTASDGTTGIELWRSDGTEAGTVLVKDIRAGGDSSSPSHLTALGGTLFFSATDASGDTELWSSDGTDAGTARVRDINPGSASSAPDGLVVVGEALFFSATESDGGTELWTSDGTEVGTVRVRDIEAGVGGSAPDWLTAVGEVLFLTATDSTSGAELWTSDGTEAGTVRVSDLPTATLSSSPIHLTAAGPALFFAATDQATGNELWKSDGTEAGTFRVRDINEGFFTAAPNELVALGSTVFFQASHDIIGAELWKSDGTEAGTVCVRDIYTMEDNGSSPSYLTLIGSTLFFSAIDGDYGEGVGAELWQSDGTEAGTVCVRDIVSGGSSMPANLTAVLFTLFFAATDGTSGIELWKSDGTEAGTVLVKDIYSGSSSSSPAQLTAVGPLLFFAATNGASNTELWKSDGTAAGTVQVKDIRSGSSSLPANLTALGDVLFFTASDGTIYGTELWKSDGTEAGTVCVKNIRPGVSSSSPANLTVVGQTLFFSATDGTSVQELWRSDGTEAGTVRVKDIRPGSLGSFPQNLTAVGTTLLFQADDGLHGAELWQSDGTEEGTFMVADLVPGGAGSAPGPFVVAGERIYFPATDNEHGRELWWMPLPHEAPAAPSDPDAQDIGTDRITWTWTDHSSDEMGFTVWLDEGTDEPVTERATTAADVTAWTQTGLSANVVYSFQVASTDELGLHSARTPLLSRCTLANPPLAPLLSWPSPPTALQLQVAPGDGNSPATDYAFRISSLAAGDQWLQADGSLGPDPVYRTAAEWGLVTVTGLAEQAFYAFAAVARNGEGIETALGPAVEGVAVGTRIHVDWERPDDSGDGLSWATAKRTLQAAVDAVTGAHQVWVRGGTYAEARPNAEGSLVLQTGVALYGGFAGNETDLEARDIAGYPTIVSGAMARAGEAAYHVVRLYRVAGTRLDGFTITGGVTGDGGDGGGVACYYIDATNTIADCTILGNAADIRGGGVYCCYSSTVLERCTIAGNTAAEGGGVSCFPDASPTLLDCVIRGNEALFSGGGVACASASRPLLQGCAIVANQALDSGGGVALNLDCDTALIDCLIAANTAQSGGGGLSALLAAPSLAGCTIAGNETAGHGGGAHCESADLSLTNCIISGNRAAQSGGGVRGSYGSLSFTACTIDGNDEATLDRDGVFCSGAITTTVVATLTNCIVSNHPGTALWDWGFAEMVVIHCLFFGNGEGDFYDDDSGIHWVEDGFGGIAPGGSATGCLGGDPRFVMDSPVGLRGTWSGAASYDAVAGVTTLTAAAGTFVPESLADRLLNPDRTDPANECWQALVIGNTDAAVLVWGDHTYAAAGDAFRLVDYRLRGGSAALDQGTAAGAPSTDIEGNPRPVDLPDVPGAGTHDIGAYELQSLPPYAPPAPDAPDLTAASDTGASATDDLTSLGNGSPATRLSFAVGGTVAGLTVRLYADGVLLGSAAASGTTTTVQTDGETVLTEGAHGIAATQAEPGYEESAASPALSVTIDTTPPQLQSAVSRKTHGSAGTFDLSLPVAEPWGIECRMAGVSTMALVLRFDESVYLGEGFAVTVTSGTASPGAVSASATTLALELSAVADVQWLQLRLGPIEDPAGNALDLAYTLGILAGDVTGGGTVNAQDILFVRYNSLQPLDLGVNFRYDLNASGAINAQDVLFVRYYSLHALPSR